MSSSPDPRGELADAISRALDGRAIGALTRLSGGASRETWRFEADGEPLILQRQRAGDTRDMEVEASVLRAAAATGVPVPHLLASGRFENGARYMIQSWVDGETIARKILRDDDFASARDSLVGQFATALAAVHSIPVDDVPGLPTTDQVAQYRQSLDDLNAQLQQSHPAFELAFRWLEANRPASARRTVVHGDFRLGNVMVGPEGLRAVLDWELAHIGDPMEDLGWLCVRAWRFGSDLPVAGVGNYDALLAAYESATGSPADPEALLWWEVLGTVKWGIMCMLQASAHLLGFSRSHELAAIGRRVCENEYDILLALEGRWSSLGVS
jgi:aminoglycoside phosphotransferase (APT) family kinase protein